MRQYDTGTQRHLLGVQGNDLRLGLGRRGPLHPQRHRRHAPEHVQLQPAAAGPGGRRPLRLLPDRRRGVAKRSRRLRLDRTRSVNTAVAQDTMVDAKASRDVYALDGGNLALAVGYEFPARGAVQSGLPGRTRATSWAWRCGRRSAHATSTRSTRNSTRRSQNMVSHRGAALRRLLGRAETTNPKVGIKWTALLSSCAARGQTAFRAPGLYETGTDRRRIWPGHRPGALSGHRPAPPTATRPGSASTSAIRGPEAREVDDIHARRDLGSRWPGLSTALDYWNIRVDGRIASTDNPVLVRDATPTTCRAFQNSGTILRMRPVPQNASNIRPTASTSTSSGARA